ncbi:MAG: glycosyltransferase [Lutibacter sp.]|nr:glycosyltransferase [Lutibacter sp.]
MPLISIITINFNNLEGLKKTMQSVFEQTYKNFEYIVIDGGSTDGSAAYIENHKDTIDYWVSETDTGIYNAMNKGIKVAKGEYLLFLNSGDHLINTNVLSDCNSFINLYELIYFNLKIINTNDSYIRCYPDKLPFSYLVNDTLPHPATFIKATLFDKVGLYDENYLIVSDWKFFIESICKYNVSYKRIDRTLSVFYLDGISSQLNNREIINKEKNKILNKEFSAYVDDIKLLLEINPLITNLKKSRKINFLIKLGLLNKF